MPVDIGTEMRLAFLRAAVAAQTDEEVEISRARAVYGGAQGIELTDRQKEYLGSMADELKDKAFANMCKRCVQIPLERLAVTDITGPDGATSGAAEKFKQWWKSQRMGVAQNTLYECVLRDKCAAIIVGWDDMNRVPTFTVNELWDGEDGTLRLHYDTSTGDLLYASKRWVVVDPLVENATGKLRLTIYLPGAIYRYEEARPGAQDWRLLTPDEIGGLPNPQPWTVDGEMDGEPLGLPVIPFWNAGNVSEIDDVLMIQKAINKSLTDHLSNTDLHGFPLLTGSGVSFPIDPATGQEVVPAFGPGRLLYSSDPNGRFARIEPADLMKTFEAGVMAWIRVLSAVKGYPMFMFDKTLTPPSGVALSIMEGPLVSQIEMRQGVFADAWRDVFEMARRVAKAYGVNVPGGEVDFEWKPAHTVDKTAGANYDKLRWESAEVPRRQRLREAGYSDEEIEAMLAEEQADNAALAAQTAALVQERMRLQDGADQENTSGDQNGGGTEPQGSATA